MRAQDHAGPLRRDIETVLHGAGWVVLREVEGVEVEPLGLELRTLGDLVTHRDEHVGDALTQRGDRVPGTRWHAVPRQRDIDGFGPQGAGVPLGLQLGATLVEGGLHGRAAGVEPLAGLGPGLGWQRTDLPA